VDPESTTQEVSGLSATKAPTSETQRAEPYRSCELNKDTTISVETRPTEKKREEIKPISKSQQNIQQSRRTKKGTYNLFKLMFMTATSDKVFYSLKGDKHQKAKKTNFLGSVEQQNNKHVEVELT